MPFEPDIIVTSNDPSDIAVVIEAKANSHNLDDAERQLTDYMAGIRSPVGILVTPEKLRLYRDQYLPSFTESIRLVGEFDVRNVLRFSTERRNRNIEIEFEDAVQSWLESLTTQAGLSGLPPDLRHAVQLYLLPALSQGVVRAGHPRLTINV